jgi:mannose-1-phosphate guanylyltransferase
MIAVIQAGGKGTRLRPYTLALPKPLMPIGDMPIIECLLKWLRRWGVKDIWITLGYLGGLMRSLCGDGRQWDLNIRYCEEPEPLGTIGALSLIRHELTETFLTINGDIISDLNLHEFINHHHTKKGMITVGVNQKSVNVDLGVLEGSDGLMKGFKEKPVLDFTVSMGIYCMEPSILDLIPDNVPFGFDDLMHEMLNRKEPVYMFRHKGLWLDIGREVDFKNAQNRFMGEYRSKVLGC